MPRAFLSGCNGQDGSYLAELLLEKGYEVHGLLRRVSVFNTERIDHIFDKLTLHRGDILDGQALSKIVAEVNPNEIYHLAAQSHVGDSFKMPAYTIQVGVQGTLNMLEAARQISGVKFYNASSSEMFGNEPAPQNEKTRFAPVSPYACAKVTAHHMCCNYRQNYGMFVCNGILFNHESERRGETFITRKVTRAATRIKCGLQDKLLIGNLDAKRDWGYAPDYVRAMWQMLQKGTPDDYVIATGITRSVQQLATIVFSRLGMDWIKYAEIDGKQKRPIEVNELCGDSSKAKQYLGWDRGTGFGEMIDRMIASDMNLALKEAAMR